MQDHDTLIHISVRLNAIFNPMKRFLNLYINGVEPLNQQVQLSMLFVSMFHTEILFSMASIEVASTDNMFNPALCINDSTYYVQLPVNLANLFSHGQ